MFKNDHDHDILFPHNHKSSGREKGGEPPIVISARARRSPIDRLSLRFYDSTITVANDFKSNFLSQGCFGCSVTA